MQTPNHENMERFSFLVAMGLVTLLFLYLMRPFFGVIFWACVIGVLFYPLQWRLLEQWKGRPNLAAFVTLLLAIIIVIIPVLFVFTSFVQEGIAVYQRLQDSELDFSEYVEKTQHAFPALQNLLERFNIDMESIQEQLTKAAIAISRFVAQNAVQVGQGTLQFFVSLCVMLYLAFFLLRDGPKLVALLIRALPLGDEREYLLFSKFAEVTRATVKGNLVVAAAQGTLGGLIFWILGVPGPFLWGAIMTLLSLIPVVGAGLIWAPVAIYFFAVGNWVDGLILSVFGVAVIGLVDNILRPILVGRDTKLPDYIVLLSTLGGFVLFGMNGFVIGPLVAALFVAFWQIFMKEFNPSEQDEEHVIEELVEEDPQ